MPKQKITAQPEIGSLTEDQKAQFAELVNRANLPVSIDFPALKRRKGQFGVIGLLKFRCGQREASGGRQQQLLRGAIKAPRIRGHG